MNLDEVIHFLLPQWGDPIQLTFFLVIVGMMALAVIWAHSAANAHGWEKKWYGKDGKKNTGDDLDIEHGSVTDLWHAVATAGEKLAEIMPGLLLVVGLLGTFLGLGLALNHASNILGHQDAGSVAGAANSMNDLMGLLKGLGTKFKTSTWGICGFVLLKIWSELTRFEEKRLAWVIGKVKTELEKRRDDAKAEDEAKQQVLYNQITAAASSIVAGFAEQANIARQQTKDLGETLQSVLDGSAAAATRDAGELKDVLAKSSAESREVIGAGLSALLAPLAEISSESKSTSGAMTAFTQNTEEIVRQMAASADGMKSGANRVSGAASKLNDAVDDFSTKFASVLEDVRRDLASAIKEMSKSSAETMKTGSEKLEGATKEISVALASLSGDIKQTLGEVKGSIGESLKIQNKAFGVFESTSQTLNAQVEKSTQTANSMKESIESGLQGVSNASRNNGQLAKQMQEVARMLEELPSGIKDTIASGLSGISEPSGPIGKFVKQLGGEAALKDDARSGRKKG